MKYENHPRLAGGKNNRTQMLVKPRDLLKQRGGAGSSKGPPILDVSTYYAEVLHCGYFKVK